MRAWTAALVLLTVSCSNVASQPSTTPARALQSPQPRSLAVMAYDQKHKVTLLYGGSPTRGIPYFDTWAWNGTHWAEQHPATNPKLWSSSMVYDQARQQIVLFGTTAVSGGVVDGMAGQTWVWDGANWRQEHPRTSPNARHRPQMVYDSTLREIIMFGGAGPKEETFTDTWVWNGSDWRNVSASIPGLPAGGFYGASAYDPAIDRVVLYNSASYSGAVEPAIWLFDGTSWSRQSVGGTALPTDGFSMVYDLEMQKLVLFGGEDIARIATGIDLALKSDIWTWDGQIWQRLPASTGPHARRQPAMDYDTDARLIVVFGGQSIVAENEFALADTWTWNGSTWTGHGSIPKVATAVFNLTIDGSVPSGDRFLLEFLPFATLAETTFCQASPPCQGAHSYTLRFQVMTSGPQSYRYFRVHADGSAQMFQAGTVDLTQPINITAHYRY